MTKTGGMPPPQPFRRYDWAAAMDEMQQAVGEPVLMEEFTDMDSVKSAYNSALNGGIRAFKRVPGYHVVANVRSSYTDEATGRLRGDLWLTLVPDQED